ncbi:MAG: YscO family type III secretion system apparatus protein [Victivallales bacterium]|nr:YscO family type III secretion system apparatus protein [Victivallales bacterium]
MAKYVLDPLLDIRKKREDDLQQQLIKARSDLQMAEDARDKAKQDLEDYIADMPEKKARLYAAVMNMVVKREQLDKLKEALADLERQRMVLAEKLEKAEQNVVQARQTLEQTQKNLLAATKNKMKLDTHKDIWLEEEKRIEAENEEKELEDLHNKISPVGDDDDSL